MGIYESMKSSGGVWLITYKYKEFVGSASGGGYNRYYRIAIDLDNNYYDVYDWYKSGGRNELQQEVNSDSLEWLFKDIKSIKKLEA